MFLPSRLTLTPAQRFPFWGWDSDRSQTWALPWGPKEAPQSISCGGALWLGPEAVGDRARSYFANLFHCLIFHESVNNHHIKIVLPSHFLLKTYYFWTVYSSLPRSSGLLLYCQIIGSRADRVLGFFSRLLPQVHYPSPLVLTLLLLSRRDSSFCCLSV